MQTRELQAKSLYPGDKLVMFNGRTGKDRVADVRRVFTYDNDITLETSIGRMHLNPNAHVRVKI